MKVGLIGYGNIAKKHEKALAKIDNAELVAVYDTHWTSKPNCNTYDSLNDFLALDLDLVTVCTPNALHPIHSIKALEGGKNVLCDKPMALKLSDAEQMISVAQKSGLLLSCTCLLYTSPSPRDS